MSIQIMAAATAPRLTWLNGLAPGAARPTAPGSWYVLCEMGPLVELKCASCTAPLPRDADGDGVIECAYCHHRHRSIEPAPTRRRAPRVGDEIAVSWGRSWWPATVLEVVGPDAWKIRYDGWSSSWDEVVGPERIRDRRNAAAAPTPRTPGVSRVRPARWMLGFAVVVVVSVIGAMVLLTVLRTGEPAGVAPEGQPATAQTELSVGQRIQVQWQGGWYWAEVLETHDDGRVRVHYEGYGDDWDEDVPRGRVRVLD